MLREFAHVRAVTDNKMDTEEAAIAREKMAAASKAKRAARAKELRRQNEAYRERVRNTKAATDDDVTDDATGAARRRMRQSVCAR